VTLKPFTQRNKGTAAFVLTGVKPTFVGNCQQSGAKLSETKFGETNRALRRSDIPPPATAGKTSFKINSLGW
jgi:hypothetical protein